MRSLHNAVKEAINDQKVDKGAAIGDRAFQAYLDELGGIYEEYTDESPKQKVHYYRKSKVYWGPFFVFVEKHLCLTDPDRKMSNNALGSAIRREMKAQEARSRSTTNPGEEG